MKLEEGQFLIALGVILILSSPAAQAWRSFKVVLHEFPYEFNSDVMDVKLQIQNNTNDETTLNAVVNALEDIDDVYLHYTIDLEANEGNYSTLVNRSLNFCKFLSQRSIEPLLRVIYEDISKQGNFIKACPIKKGIYSLREYRVDEEKLPSYVPETNFYANVQLNRANGDMLFKGRLQGKIDKSKGFNNLKMFSLG